MMVICNFNMFDKNQKIMVANEETGELTVFATTDFDNLGTDIAKACQKVDSYKVHLYGQEDYINTVIPHIHEYLGSSYGLDKLEIEVN